MIDSLDCMRIIMVRGLARKILHRCNVCNVMGIYPDDMKIAKVIALF